MSNGKFDHTETESDNSNSDDISKELINFLKKGPNFRLPNTFDAKFWKRLDSDFEAFFYRLRWKLHLERSPEMVNINIPFDRKRCTLPKPLDPDCEFKLKMFFQECKKVIKKETKYQQNNLQETFVWSQCLVQEEHRE